MLIIMQNNGIAILQQFLEWFIMTWTRNRAIALIWYTLGNVAFQSTPFQNTQFKFAKWKLFLSLVRRIHLLFFLLRWWRDWCTSRKSQPLYFFFFLYFFPSLRWPSRTHKKVVKNHSKECQRVRKLTISTLWTILYVFKTAFLVSWQQEHPIT